jgi:uncharacterized Zn-binding protein involved in type VI secretion
MTGLEIAGLAIAAGGALYGGYKQNQMAKFNAKLQGREAKYQRQKAESDVTQRRRDVARQMGANKAAVGGSGVSLMSGSVVDTEFESLSEAEQDFHAIRFGGETRASAAEGQASLDRAGGKAARTGSYFKAGSTLLSGYGRGA